MNIFIIRAGVITAALPIISIVNLVPSSVKGDYRGRKALTAPGIIFSGAFTLLSGFMTFVFFFTAEAKSAAANAVIAKTGSASIDIYRLLSFTKISLAGFVFHIYAAVTARGQVKAIYDDGSAV
jgi:hypothetical protein